MLDCEILICFFSLENNLPNYKWNWQLQAISSDILFYIIFKRCIKIDKNIVEMCSCHHKQSRFTEPWWMPFKKENKENCDYYHKFGWFLLPLSIFFFKIASENPIFIRLFFFFFIIFSANFTSIFNIMWHSLYYTFLMLFENRKREKICTENFILRERK